jgi:hypothetical protein
VCRRVAFSAEVLLEILDDFDPLVCVVTDVAAVCVDENCAELLSI